MNANLLLLIIAIVVVYHMYRHLHLTRVRAGVREWNVIGGFNNKREAAELLAQTNATMIEFFRYLKKKYHIDEPDDVIAAEGNEHSELINHPGDVYNIVDYLLDNYNPDVFYENDPRHTKETSYTLNKGSAMYICLRKKNIPNKLVDKNILLFVMLHEASHIAYYRGWGHNDGFWTTFKFILHEATLAGIYTPVDYSKYPVNYCGLNVSYNPLFDDSLPNIWERV
jgi:hypothetical protein